VRSGTQRRSSILRAAYNAGVDVEGLKEKDPIIAEVPFSSSYKFMSDHSTNRLQKSMARDSTANTSFT
jgi:magnesium-transporting ATPase (P-type)